MRRNNDNTRPDMDPSLLAASIVAAGALLRSTGAAAAEVRKPSGAASLLRKAVEARAYLGQRLRNVLGRPLDEQPARQ